MKRARDVLAHAPVAILEMDLEGGRFRSLSDEACRMVGYTREELLRKSFWDLADAQSQASFRTRVERKRAGLPVPDSIEYRVRAKDGRWLDLLVHIGAFTYNDGEPESVLAIAQDITERKRNEEALRTQSSAAVGLLQALDRATVFDLLAERVHAAAEGALVAVSEFDPRAGKILVRHVRCASEDRRLFAALLGRDPERLSLDLTDETRRRWRSGELTPVAGGLFELFFRQVPRAACEAMEVELGIGDVFGMACAYEEDILGTVAVIARERGELRNRPLIEALVAQAALALKRMRAEEARRESEERFRLLFESTSDGVWVHGLDGFIREVNDAYCAMSGYERTELEGMPISTLEAVEGPEEVAAHIRDLLGSGGHDRFESRHRRKDGSLFDVDVTVVHVDQDGGRIATFVRDITERRRMERLYAVLSRANEAIVRTPGEKELFARVCEIVAREGDFPLAWIGLVKGRAVEPAACDGPEADYVSGIRVEVDGELGAGPTGTCIREDRPVVNDDFVTNPSAAPWRRQAIAHGFRASAALPLHKDGRPIGALTLYSKRPRVFDAAQVKLLESLCADVSYALGALEHERRRREMEDALREADRRKDEFLAILSHELRNPLAPIRNSLFVLARAGPAGEQARRARAIIDRQVTHLTRLVDDLLEVTRITRGKIHLKRETFELGDLVRRTVEDHRSVFVANGIRLEGRLPVEPIWVDADATRIAQVVGNLLANAAKFTSRGGHVDVTLEREADAAVLHVTDDGVGMPPEVLSRLFQPFVQAAQTLERSGGGLGLGLALVKGLVDLHGGSVSAKSAGAGLGSELTVRIPLAAAPAQEPAAPAPGPVVRRRILVIEDSRDTADSLQEALELVGHEVAVAYSGPEGLETARKDPPEVLLCDIGLPGMDGYAVARAFRADAALAGTTLVALSGYALPEDLQRAAEAGFERHMAKPPSLEKLEKLLAELPERTG